MPERDESEPRNTGIEQDVQGRGDEGRRNREVTPPIGEDAAEGQTAIPASSEEVGIPPDEEMGRPPERDE